MVGGWVILGLILVQLKFEIQMEQNFGLFLVSVGKITYKISTLLLMGVGGGESSTPGLTLPIFLLPKFGPS